MKNKTQKIIFRWCLVAANMLIIFWFSSQNGESSGEMSGFVAAVLEHIMVLKWAMQYINIRKAAHFSIYFLLGILTIRAVMLHSKRSVIRITAALMICFIYACTDEFHQAFVPGRGPSFRDVLIDSAGALAGITVVSALSRMRRNLWYWNN